MARPGRSGRLVVEIAREPDRRLVVHQIGSVGRVLLDRLGHVGEQVRGLGRKGTFTLPKTLRWTKCRSVWNQTADFSRLAG